MSTVKLITKRQFELKKK